VSKAREVVVLVAAALLAVPLVSQAAIVFTTDSATLLQGTFAFEGNLAAAETQVTTTFRLLPGPDDDLRQAVSGRRQFGESSGSFFFGSTGEGNPDDPYRTGSLNAIMTSFGPFSGSYTNGGQLAAGGTPVYWLFSNWQDTGGQGGIASGSFCFSTVATNCPGVPAVPLPGAAWLLLSGLGGLGVLGRRRKTA
jgi:hypothetical protein